MATRGFLRIAAGVTVMLLAGCGRPEAKAPAAAEAKAAPAPEAAPEGRLVEVVANDSMRFDVTEIVAAPGEKISLRLTNTGSMPKQAMGHNLVILQASADPRAYAMAAVSAARTEYLPPSLQEQVIAATAMLGPKESDLITFTAPSAPGEYPYLCSFPAHFAAGMKGVLIVR